jgi:hypothetical protein
MFEEAKHLDLSSAAFLAGVTSYRGRSTQEITVQRTEGLNVTFGEVSSNLRTGLRGGTLLFSLLLKLFFLVLFEL